MALVYPRYVHGKDGAHLLVENEAKKDEALEAGYALEPLLSEEQAANVKAAKIAAGELAADDVVEDVAVSKKKKKSEA